MCVQSVVVTGLGLFGVIQKGDSQRVDGDVTDGLPRRRWIAVGDRPFGNTPGVVLGGFEIGTLCKKNNFCYNKF